VCDAGGKPIAGHKAANLSDYRTNSNPSAFSYGEPEHRKRTAHSDGGLRIIGVQCGLRHTLRIVILKLWREHYE